MMNKIGHLIGINRKKKPKIWDEKSIFYAFKRVIADEYGKKGAQILTPRFIKNKKLFIASQSSNWANEIWINRHEIIRKLNQELDSEEIAEIKME